jgi:hypothetical protein
MTIEFNCPKCGALIAFDSRHAGKRAKCLTCRQPLIIPAASFEKPKKLEVEPEFEAEPIPGFCRAVFLDSWKLFVRPQNATTLVFVAAVVCFKFFLAGACCITYVAAFVIWGWLFGFYLNVIYRTAIDDDMLPEIDLGTSVTFVLYILEPFFVFFYTLFLVELPFLIAFWLARDRGVTLQNLWSHFGALHVLQALLIFGLFLFPAAILTTAVGKDLTLLRPDYLLAPIFRAFFPYVTTVLLLAAACLIEWRTTQYAGADPVTTAGHLALNLTVQAVAIIAMRSIGLLYRHYACYFRW